MSAQRRVMITGASEGIGRAFARRLAHEGYAIRAVARNEKRLQELMTELGADHHTYRVADLSTPEGVAAIAEDLATNRFHLLINNAGFGIYGAFYNAELPKLETMIRLNCDTLMALSHAFLQQAKKGDALVIVSSALAFMPMPSAGTYAATKAFVTSFTESLWYEQKERGIYVMGLCPGRRLPISTSGPAGTKPTVRLPRSPRSRKMSLKRLCRP
jgi:short-subunit dehydrogenase